MSGEVKNQNNQNNQIELGNIRYEPTDFQIQYLLLSGSDGHHDKFHEREYTHYFPSGYQTLTDIDPRLSEDKLAREIFGAYDGTRNDMILEGSMLPASHSMIKITTEMGYKYASVSKMRTDGEQNKVQQASVFVSVLNNLSITPQDIYLCVDVPAGFYDVINSISDDNDWNNKFTVVYNRATMTDPAPNSLPVLKQNKNNFIFTPANLSPAIVSGKKLKFSIEDPAAAVKSYRHYKTIENMQQVLSDPTIKSDLSDLLGASLMSKYEVKLSYAKPNKYQKLLQTQKGINPKKLKASLSIIMPSEGKVRIMDSKLCEKSASDVGLMSGANLFLTILNRRFNRVMKLWSGDSKGGTHALGKKCGDWIQGQRTLDPDLTIRPLESVQKGTLLSNSKWNYGNKIKIGNKIKALVTHDRILKQYALTIGVPFIIFKNAGQQIYEIYVKNYLSQIDREQVRRSLQNCVTSLSELETIFTTYQRNNDQVKNLLENLNVILNSSIDGLSPLQINDGASLINPGINLIRNGINFDITYRNYIKKLYSVKLILMLSDLQVISSIEEKKIALISETKKVIQTQIPQAAGNQTLLKELNKQFIEQTKKLNQLKAEIFTIQPKLQENITLTETVINNFIQFPGPDIDHCGIFKWKVYNRSSFAQRQKLVSENIGEVYLNSILETEAELVKIWLRLSLYHFYLVFLVVINKKLKNF